MNQPAKIDVKPSDYKHIAALGSLMHSHSWYVVQQQEKACAEGAPLDAVDIAYAPDGSGPTGAWRTVSEYSVGFQQRLNLHLA